MKKLLILSVLITCFLPLLSAAEGPHPHLTREEFRARQQNFIAEKAGLTEEEAARFFPVYFELQDRKKQLNDEAWRLLRGGRDEKTTETQYEEIMQGVYKARTASAQLDMAYYEKFRKILTAKKIYRVQKAEMRFHQELLKGLRNKKAPAPGKAPSKKK